MPLVALATYTGHIQGSKEFPLQSGSVPQNVALSPDGTLVYTMPDRVRIKDLYKPWSDHEIEKLAGQNQGTFYGMTQPDQLVISQGRIIALTDTGGPQGQKYVRLYSLETGEPVTLKYADGQQMDGRCRPTGAADVSLRVVGPRLYVIARDAAVCYNLDNPEDTYRIYDQEGEITTRMSFIGKDYLIFLDAGADGAANARPSHQPPGGPARQRRRAASRRRPLVPLLRLRPLSHHPRRKRPPRLRHENRRPRGHHRHLATLRGRHQLSHRRPQAAPADRRQGARFGPTLTALAGSPMSQLLDFYRLAEPDSEGRMLYEIWAWDDAALEQCHDFIQWMFPLAEPSGFNPDAPLVSEEDRLAFLRESQLRKAMRRSLSVFLAFIGLALAPDGRVVRAPDFEHRLAVWKYPNHNWLRITRVLKSLRLLGLEAEAGALGPAEGLAREHGLVCEDSFEYWRNAATH